LYDTFGELQRVANKPKILPRYTSGSLVGNAEIADRRSVDHPGEHGEETRWQSSYTAYTGCVGSKSRFFSIFPVNGLTHPTILLYD
jgi:hypothetical protein